MSFSCWLHSVNADTPDLEALFRPHLNPLEIDVDEIRIDPDWIEFSSSHAVKPFQQLLMKNPLQSPQAVHILSTLIAENTPTAFSGLLAGFSILMNHRANYTSKITNQNHSPTIDEFTSLLEELYAVRGMPPPDSKKDWETAFHPLPDPLRTLLYQFFLTLKDAWSWLESARGGIHPFTTIEEIEAVYHQSSYSTSEIALLARFDREFDRRAVYLAAQAVAGWLENAIHTVETEEMDFHRNLHFDTAFGTVYLAGEDEDSVHRYDQSPLLLIDFSGNDTYLSPYSNADSTLSFSITLDLQGSDRYRSEDPDDRSGSARFGVSALIDLQAGEDTFTGHTQCFGYAFAGAALVYNASGSSHYSIHSTGLGAADFGVALFIDAEGDDTYESHYKSQGAGFADGVGFLFDLQGNDTYIAHATPIVVASAQLPKQNFSASQGFGTGRFGPLQEGYSLQGGLGMLLDASGNDIYQGSVFTQGAGYGYGIGLLTDLNGDDTYSCSWYGAGAAAHQACGIAIDAAGNDTLTASHYMTGGAAIDLALGVFIDPEGDDTYRAQNASFGYGLDNAIGLFADLNGDDDYHLTNGLGMGKADNKRTHTLRGLWDTFGLFYDTHGMNTVFPLGLSHRQSQSVAENKTHSIYLGKETNKEPEPAE